MPENEIDTWKKVDGFFTDALVPADPSLDAALASNHDAGLPPIDVTPCKASSWN